MFGFECSVYCKHQTASIMLRLTKQLNYSYIFFFGIVASQLVFYFDMMVILRAYQIDPVQPTIAYNCYYSLLLPQSGEPLINSDIKCVHGDLLRHQEENAVKIVPISRPQQSSPRPIHQTQIDWDTIWTQNLFPQLWHLEKLCSYFYISNMIQIKAQEI